MTDQERLNLLIERHAFAEVIRQFDQRDARMEIGLDAFLCSIEDEIRKIDDRLRESP
jgi:hypothetical protein